MSNETKQKAHPFELAGMGIGPYQWVGFWSFPSPELAEANPTAYNMALQDAPKLSNGCGSCANCGMGIRNICIVRGGDGKVWGVGCDCVEKAGDPALGDKAKVALAKHNAALRRAANERKREANRQEWLNKVCNEQGETNAERLARENSERKAVQDRAEGIRAQIAEILTPFARVLLMGHEGRGGFRDNVGRAMLKGLLPEGRGVDIAIDIIAKEAGRRGCNAYNIAMDRAGEAFSKAQELEATI